MKLLMISGDRSILEGRQGAFWYTLQELRKYWDRIDIICPRPDVREVQLFDGVHNHCARDGDGGEVFFHPSPKGLFFQKWWIVTKGKELIAAQKHDVMTVHVYPPFYNSRGARSLARKTGIPYVMEVHHIVGFPRASSPAELIGRLLSRMYLPFAARRADGIRAVSSVTAETLSRWHIPAKKIHVVPSFYLDGNVLNPDARPPIAYDVSFSGRLVPNKGLQDVVRAIAQIPSARLLVIGDGPERIVCEKIAEDLQISNRVTFLGWLPTQEAVVGAVLTARMFVMNSRSEGGPRNALEAMGCGMPVIVTRVGVMPDVIQDGRNGIFTSGESDDLVHKIGMLMRDEERCAEIGKEARKILDRFERKKLVKEYAEFLQSFA